MATPAAVAGGDKLAALLDEAGRFLRHGLTGLGRHGGHDGIDMNLRPGRRIREVVLHEVHHVALPVGGGAEIGRPGHLGGIEQAPHPVGRSEPKQVGSRRRRDHGCGILGQRIDVGMAARTVLGEEPRPLALGVAADEFEHASGGNPLGPAGQFDRPRGVGLRLFDGVEKGLRVAHPLQRFPLLLDRRRLAAVSPDGRDELGGVAPGLLGEPLGFRQGRRVHPDRGVVFVEGQRREQAHARQDREREGHVEPVAQPPVADDRHQEHPGHDQSGHDDRPEELPRGSPALEDFQELKEKQEIPLGPRGGVGQRRIGRRAQLRAEFARHDRLARKHRPQGRHQDHAEHDGHHGQHRHGVLEHLVGPEHRVGPGERLLRVQAVLAKQRQMHHEKQHERDRQESGMEGEEPRQRVVAILRAADHELLDRRPDERHDPGEVRGHDRGPVALLIPGQQIAGERHAEHE